MRASPQLPADAAIRATLFDRARQQGMAQELADLVVVEVRKQERRKRKLTRGVGLLALFLAVGLWAVPYYRSTDTISTRTANRQTLALSDGSRADLNAQTQLKTDFRYGRRAVRLTEGEAFFNVAKDAAHPFLVETPAGTVQVTGTQFNVRLLPNKSAEVTLLEGSVAIHQTGTDSQLSPGEQLTFGSGREQRAALRPAELERVTAWRDGRLILDELTVAEAAARMSRYHGKRIDVDPEAGTILLGGSCPLDDLPAFLESLKATQKLSILDNRDGSCRVLLRQP